MYLTSPTLATLKVKSVQGARACPLASVALQLASHDTCTWCCQWLLMHSKMPVDDQLLSPDLSSNLMVSEAPDIADSLCA